MEGKLGPVDILVANAGIAGPDTPAEKMTDEAWQRILDVNLNGVFWSCRTFGKRMVEGQHGAIVTVGSMSGFISNKPSKAGELQFLKGSCASFDSVFGR